MQLKALIKRIAAEKNITAQHVMQSYVLERLLERITLSPYKQNFILKGGFLIAAIVGLDTRATMDLDTTLKGMELTHASLKSIFEEICTLPVKDNLTFKLVSTKDIREADDYPGIRVDMKAEFSPVSVPFAVDVTTGDKITPHEIEYLLPLMFDDRNISIMAYPIETVLAEKLETVISRGIANTRPRDFYDIHTLWKLRGDIIKLEVLCKALMHTSKKRGSQEIMVRYDSILSDVLASEQLRSFWQKYQADFPYAADIAFEAAIISARELLEMVDKH